MAAKPAADWAVVRSMYQDAILQGKPISLAEVALHYKLHADTVRKRAAKEQWRKQALAKLETTEEDIESRLGQHQDRVVEEMARTKVHDEVTVRTRHAQISRALQAKALTKLNKVKPEELSVKQAVEMLQLGIREERLALGINERLVANLSAMEEQNEQTGGAHHGAVAAGEADALLQKLLDRRKILQAAGEKGGPVTTH